MGFKDNYIVFLPGERAQQPQPNSRVEPNATMANATAADSSIWVQHSEHHAQLFVIADRSSRLGMGVPRPCPAFFSPSAAASCNAASSRWRIIIRQRKRGSTNINNTNTPDQLSCAAVQAPLQVHMISRCIW